MEEIVEAKVCDTTPEGVKNGYTRREILFGLQNAGFGAVIGALAYRIASRPRADFKYIEPVSDSWLYRGILDQENAAKADPVWQRRDYPEGKTVWVPLSRDKVPMVHAGYESINASEQNKSIAILQKWNSEKLVLDILKYYGDSGRNQEGNQFLYGPYNEVRVYPGSFVGAKPNDQGSFTVFAQKIGWDFDASLEDFVFSPAVQDPTEHKRSIGVGKSLEWKRLVSVETGFYVESFAGFANNITRIEPHRYNALIHSERGNIQIDITDIGYMNGSPNDLLISAPGRQQFRTRSTATLDEVFGL